MAQYKTGWGGWIRTNEMPESESGALPLGDAPINVVVGMEGFEPPASCSQGKRASQTALHPENRAMYIISNKHPSVKHNVQHKLDKKM